MRVLVLVLAARAWPYPLLVRTIRRTWAAEEPPGVSILFYVGGDRLRLRGRRLELPVSDALPDAGRKTLACFEHVLAGREFDLVLRTNCSSYVDLPNLRDWAGRNARAHGFYAGFRGMYGTLPFASGAGYFLSRDLVELAVRHRDEWDHSLLDDVALADLMHRHDVAPVPAPRVEYTSARNVGEVDTSQFLFRCKTDSPWRIGDVRILIKLHQAFCRSRGRVYRSPLLQVTTALGKLYEAWLRTRLALRTATRR